MGACWVCPFNSIEWIHTRSPGDVYHFHTPSLSIPLNGFIEHFPLTHQLTYLMSLSIPLNGFIRSINNIHNRNIRNFQFHWMDSQRVALISVTVLTCSLSIPLNGFNIRFVRVQGDLVSFNSIEWIRCSHQHNYRQSRCCSFNSIEWIQTISSMIVNHDIAGWSFNSIEWIHLHLEGYNPTLPDCHYVFQFHWMDSLELLGTVIPRRCPVCFQFHWMDSEVLSNISNIKLYVRLSIPLNGFSVTNF